MKKKIINKDCAVGYCRFSSSNQREESIDAQKRAIQQYADNEGWTIDHWYVDEGFSGTTDNRPGFQQMLSDSRQGLFNKVIIHKLDRFARNTKVSMLARVELYKNDVTLISVLERIDDTLESKVMVSIMEIMAEYHSSNLARETMKGLKENAYKCWCNGSTPPYGYQRVPRLENGMPVYSKKGIVLHNTVIEPTQAEAVQLMFNLTLQGKSRFEIMHRLNELGYTDAKGRPFKRGTLIDYILRNERYTGIYIFNQKKKTLSRSGKYAWVENDEQDVIRIDGGLPQIVSRETFDKVQCILQQRVHRSPSNLTEEYLLSGKIICGECGKPYHGWKKTKGGVDYIYYKCINNGKYVRGVQKDDYCHNTSIRRDKIEKIVINKVVELLSDPQLVDKIFDEYNQFLRENKDQQQHLNHLQTQIESINNQIQNIVGVIAAGHYSDALNDRLQSLENEKNDLIIKLQNEQKNLGSLQIDKNKLQQQINQVRAMLLDNTAEFSARKVILQSFLNKVVVYQNHIEIYINAIPSEHSRNFRLEITDDLVVKNNRLLGSENSSTLLAQENTISVPTQISLAIRCGKIINGAFIPTKSTDFNNFLSLRE